MPVVKGTDPDGVEFQTPMKEGTLVIVCPATSAMQFRWARELNTLAKIEAYLVAYSVEVKANDEIGGGDRPAFKTLAEEIVNGGLSAVKAQRMAFIMADTANIQNTIAYDPETGTVVSTALDPDFKSQLRAMYPVLAGVVA